MANAAPTATTWLGITTDATLSSNWDNGVPFNNDVYIGATPTTSLVGFGGVRAAGTLTVTGNFSPAEVVVLDSKTYTWVASGASADGEINVGGSAAASLDNLFDAINLVAGGDYGASMTIHPTVTAVLDTATILDAAAKDSGTGGNSIVSTTDGANASWGAGTLSGGAAVGAVFDNLWSDANWPGDINSSGSEAEIEFLKFFHRGSGTVYLKVNASGARLIVDSDNLVLAAQVVVTANLVSMEVVRGTATLNQNGVVNAAERVIVTEATATPSKLTITGTGTIGQVRTEGGFLVVNGPTITDAITGGRTQFISGTITTLENTGTFDHEASTTMPTVENLDGVFDMTTTAAAKTVSLLYQYPTADLVYRTDFDTITSLITIGVD